MAWDGDQYQQRFDALADAGSDVHGEADFVSRLHPASVLDAGCGTGRVARELARRGIDVVGVDVDDSMIATARRLAPELRWELADLAAVDLGRRFDVVVMAGNVPLLHPGGNPRPRWSPVAPATWPTTAPWWPGSSSTGATPRPTTTRTADRRGWSSTGAAATWSGEPFTDTAAYAVSVHRRDDWAVIGARRPVGGDLRTWVASRKDTMRNPMFVYDEQLTTLILDYCRWRLALDPVPLDFGGAQAASLDASLEGLINPTGTDARPHHGDLRQRTGHRGGLLRQPPFPVVHPGRADQGRPALRHGGGLLLAAGDLVDGGGRRGRRREPGPPGPVRPGRAARRGRAAASSPAGRPATCRR